MKAKKTILAVICSCLLITFTGYVLLDTFVIPRTYAGVSAGSESIEETFYMTGNAINTAEAAENSTQTTEPVSSDETATSSETASSSETAVSTETASSDETAETDSCQTAAPFTTEPVITDTSYTDSHIAITLNEYVAYSTTIYVADVQVASAEYLQTALANDVFGKNIKAATSQIAEENNAILAINGDFYGSRNSGYVLKNGTAYRNTSAGNQEDLVIYQDGSFAIINESETTLEELVNAGAWQVLAFGPALVQDSQITVSEGEEVGKAMASNPRTAIGIIDDLHYVFVVSDGRTSESSGLSLTQLAEVMQALGCQTAYNLDGGGSSTMYFNGQVVNNPTTNGNNIKERSVSDIVYIG